MGILVDLAESPVRRNLLPQADQTLVKVVFLGLLLLLLLLLRGQLGPSQCVLHCFSEVEMFSILLMKSKIMFSSVNNITKIFCHLIYSIIN